VLFVLAGVERPAAGDPVDRDEGAVEDDVGMTCSFSVPDRLPVLRRPVGGRLDDLVDVPPCRRPADADPGGQLVERLAFAQVDQHEEGFLARVGLSPPRAGGLQVPADDRGGEVERPG
jgi:hypothetical protein